MKEKTVEQIRRMKHALTPEHVVAFVAKDMHGTPACARTNPRAFFRITTCLVCTHFNRPNMSCRKGALVR